MKIRSGSSYDSSRNAGHVPPTRWGLPRQPALLASHFDYSSKISVRFYEFRALKYGAAI
jgi:hypothetical protein